MGTVYEAVQAHPPRTVALKMMGESVISPSARRRFEYEAKILARLEHPHIAQVIDAGTFREGDLLDPLPESTAQSGERETPYIVMEYVPDALPITRYAASKNLSIRDRLALFLQVCSAVNYAHRKSVIHRDLKPSNILIDGSGRVSLIDFGVARIVGGDAPITTVATEVSQLIGTLQYMSPEQCGPDPSSLDVRSDVYSLGVVLYELLCHHLPYDVSAAALFEAVRTVQEAEPRKPSSVNPELCRDLETVLLTALEKDQTRRYQSALDLQSDIDRFLRGDLISARPAGLLKRTWKWACRNPRLSVAISVSLIALLGFLGYQLLWFYPSVRAQNERALAATNASIEAKEEAKILAALAEERLQQVRRLADSKKLAELHSAAEWLWPAYPEKIPAIRTWLEKADTLLSRLPLHRQTLEALSRQPGSEAGMVSSRDPGDPAIQWQQRILSELVAGLEGISAENGLVQDVRDRLAFAKSIQARSLDEHREAWDRAVNTIADQTISPRYNGLTIKPQVGLIPIGPDRQSGFWEFCHLQTGTAPERDGEGRIQLTEETGLILILLPGGTFSMGCERPSPGRPEGSPNTDKLAWSSESPIREVTLKPFFISKYEMTQAQWERFTGTNPSGNHDTYGLETPNGLHPVEQVSWYDCARVLSRLKLRLPSEAEWEYAARGGTTTIWWTGDTRQSTAGSGNFDDISGARRTIGSLNHDTWLDDGWMGHAPVGTYLPNPFGLHDVHGNVYEWCQDSYGDYELCYDDGTAYESFGLTGKILRSASYFQHSGYSRSSGRASNQPDLCTGRLGVRPAADLEP
jgi:serine/threonine protein kinase/formylglycine-generating enzyme required for sulfatase activity